MSGRNSRIGLVPWLLPLLVLLALACDGLWARDEAKSDLPKFNDSRDAKMTPERLAMRKNRRYPTDRDILESGIAVGTAVPSARVIMPDGSENTLARFCQGKLTLLVTTSLTCPASRKNQHWVDKLGEKYKDRLNIAVIYTIEAHPSIDPSPYAKYFPERERPKHPGERSGGTEFEGLWQRQPLSIEARRKLAKQFQSRLHVKVPILLDNMDNEVWKLLGGGPNMGILVDANGIVVHKHAWLDAKGMDKSIESLLVQQGKAAGLLETPIFILRSLWCGWFSKISL